MRFEELRSVVLATLSDDWVTLAGEPTVTRLGGDVAWLMGHSSVAFLRSDLDISLAWGAEQNNGEAWGAGFTEFAQGFPDSTVYGYFADIRWRGDAVERFLYKSVDGGRAYLPDATPKYEGHPSPGNPPAWWEVSGDDRTFVRLLDELARGQHSEFESYLQRSGYVLV